MAISKRTKAIDDNSQLQSMLESPPLLRFIAEDQSVDSTPSPLNEESEAACRPNSHSDPNVRTRINELQTQTDSPFQVSLQRKPQIADMSA